MADSDSEKNDRPAPVPDPKVIKEGGYQPTTDPGPAPTSLVRPADEKPTESTSQPANKDK